MKINWNEKYNTIAAYVLIVFIIVALLFVVFFRNDTINVIFKTVLGVLRPIFIAVLIAYFLNRPMVLFETKVFKFNGTKRRLARALSVTIVYILLLGFLTGFVAIIVPQITTGYKDLSAKMPMYIESITSWLNKQAESTSIFSSIAVKVIDFFNNLINNTYEMIMKYIPDISTVITNAANVLKDIGFGIIISIYFLLSKEKLIGQSNKIMTAVFKEKFYAKLKEIWLLIDKSFGGFIIGKIFDSIIVGIISLFALWAIGVPYYPLISIIIAITNIVPIFGPLVGGILGGFIVLVTNSDLLLWFIIYDIIIQQIDGNILGPRILGDSIGLSATWIFVSITIMGAAFGFPGMIFGVPFFAVIYTLLKQYSEKKLAQKELPTDSYDYITSENGKKLVDELKAAKIKKAQNVEKRKAFYKKIKDKIFHKNKEKTNIVESGNE